MPQTRKFSTHARGGRIIQSNYDFIFAQTGEIGVCLTRQQIEWIISQVDYAEWATRWYSDVGADINQDNISAFAADLIMRLITANTKCGDDDMPYLLRQNPFDPCLLEQSIDGGANWTLAFNYDLCFRHDAENPPLQQYESTYGGLQTSYDGGQTWVDTPDNRFKDPMTNNIHKFAVDPACMTSANVVEWMKLQLEIDDTQLLIGVITAIIDLIAIILTGGVAIPLIVSLASSIIQLGIEAFQAAMTQAEWDKFQTNLYCHASADGSWTLQAYYAIMDQIPSDHDGLAEFFLYQNMIAIGFIGLNNAGHLDMAVNPDCSNIDCGEVWCYEYDFTASQQGWTIRNLPPLKGRYTANVGFQQAVAWQSNDSISVFSPSFVGTITEVTVFFNPALSGTSPRIFLYKDAFGGENLIGELSGGGTEKVFDNLNVAVTGGIAMDVDPFAGNFQQWAGAISKVRVRGIGTNPIGENNCEEE